MDGNRARADSEPSSPRTDDMRGTDLKRTGLDDPRAVQILTTEHWGLLSARTLVRSAAINTKTRAGSTA